MDVLDETLTCTVSGVCLTSEEELHGVVRVVDNLCQTIEVGEEEVRTLVGGETASKTDDESVGVDLVEE